MTENKPVLSILVPTKNREEYAIKVVQHILEIWSLISEEH